MLKHRLLSRSLIILLLIFSMLQTSTAIIIRHDRKDAEYLRLGNQFPSVCQLNPLYGGGTLVSPHWILTAAHAVEMMRPGSLVKIKNKNYRIEKTVFHPLWSGSRNDIALIKLKRMVNSVKPMAVYKKREEAGKKVMLLGTGDTGTGLTGPVKTDGKLRAATNQVTSTNKAWLIIKFDEPEIATEAEGASGPGDSGYPAIIEEDGVFYVAGVCSTQTFKGEGQSDGRYGVLDYYTRVSSYLDWIERTIQEKRKKKP